MKHKFLTDDDKLAHEFIAQKHAQDLIPFSDLRLFGITYSRMHLARLVKAKQFPAPVQAGPRRIAWTRESIDKHIAKIKATPVVP